MRAISERYFRLTNDQAYPSAVGGYESLQRETRNKQQLMMIFSKAPFTANMWRKHAEVSGGHNTSPQKCGEGRPKRGNERGDSMSSHTVMNPNGGAE